MVRHLHWILTSIPSLCCRSGSPEDATPPSPSRPISACSIAARHPYYSQQACCSHAAGCEASHIQLIVHQLCLAPAPDCHHVSSGTVQPHCWGSLALRRGPSGGWLKLSRHLLFRRRMIQVGYKFVWSEQHVRRQGLYFPDLNLQPTPRDMIYKVQCCLSGEGDSQEELGWFGRWARLKCVWLHTNCSGPRCCTKV